MSTPQARAILKAETTPVLAAAVPQARFCDGGVLELEWLPVPGATDYRVQMLVQAPVLHWREQMPTTRTRYAIAGAWPMAPGTGWGPLGRDELPKSGWVRGLGWRPMGSVRLLTQDRTGRYPFGSWSERVDFHTQPNA